MLSINQLGIFAILIIVFIWIKYKIQLKPELLPGTGFNFNSVGIDGNALPNLPLVVKNLGTEAIFEVTTKDDATLSFKVPAGHYSVSAEDGNGNSFSGEFDIVDGIMLGVQVALKVLVE